MQKTKETDFFVIFKHPNKAMSPKIKIILSVISGIIAGGFVNSGLIKIGLIVIAPPPGVENLDNPSEWRMALQTGLLECRHFVFPFLAHAIGTLTGSLIAMIFSPNKKMRTAYSVGIFFLFGGIAASILIEAPGWFIVSDLLLSYIPMAYLAGKIYTSFFSSNHKTKTP